MQPQELEPEMEAFFLRIAPTLATEWEGATEDEIEQIEQIAGRPLPRFYRWFLLRMGHRMGPLAYSSLDFSAPKVLESYASGLFVPHPRFLMIGHESDEVMPLHMLYDFDHEARGDARVVARHASGGSVYDQFDTFREMNAWSSLYDLKVRTQPQMCSGFITDDGGDVLSELRPVMESLGFADPFPEAPRC